MTETLLDLLAVYGIGLVLVVVALGCVGVPAPATVALVIAGAFVASGDLPLGPVLAAGFVGAVIGDQAGYWAGTRGDAWAARVGARAGTGATMARARAFTARWGGLAVFLSRWLFSPLGPAVNVASGMLGMPWTRFTLCGLAGKAIWVLLFTGAGYAFSHNIDTVTALSGRAVWALVGLLVLALCLWRLRAVLQTYLSTGR